MWRIVDVNGKFAPLSRSLQQCGICMKTLPTGIHEVSCDVSCLGQLGVDLAKNNSDMRDLFQRIQLLRPLIVLERSLRNQCDAMFEQKLYHIEKCFINLPLNRL